MKLALVPVALAAVLVAGCGGGGSSTSSSSPSPKDWARRPLLRDHDLVELGQDGGRVAQERQPLEGRPQEARPARSSPPPSTFSDDLKGLGKPNTDAGQQAKDAIDKLSTQVNDDVDSCRARSNDAVGNGREGRRRPPPRASQPRSRR